MSSTSKFGDYDYTDVKKLALRTDGSVCQILYSDDYKCKMAIMRGLMVANELSPRALYMTELAIELVAAHYTVWQYRYRIVKSLLTGQLLQDELGWCGQVAIQNEKNYQIWHYRQLIIGLIVQHTLGGDWSKYDVRKEEYPIVNEMLKRDEKNYHVWTHRRWLVGKFDLYGSQDELEYTQERIGLDVRNNSAWNHRYLVHASDLAKETDYVKGEIRKCPGNPSAWNYLRGIYQRDGRSLTELAAFIREFDTLPALELLAETDTEIYERLIELDPLRAAYWRARLKA